MEYHYKILEAIESVIQIEHVMSIDEVACILDRCEQTPEAIIKLSAEIKRVVRIKVGECLTLSIGAVSNKLLAKLASDMQKPDGLTILEPENMPQKIMHLKIQDISGISVNMAERLNKARISNMHELWDADACKLQRAWGGVVGKRFHALLHGEDLPSPPRQKRSLGHEHVLAPQQRSLDKAKTVLLELLIKAALRLRQENLYCQRLVVNIKWSDYEDYWSDNRTFTESQDNLLLGRVFSEIWEKAPKKKPLRVGVSLTDLVHASQHQGNLFDKPQNETLTKVIDDLNEKFGKGSIGFGLCASSSKKLTSKIAFQRVPDLSEF